MSEITCPLCGRGMTVIETYPGRGELYCVYCDLTIGGNEAKTLDELTALLEQRTCRNISDPPSGFLCSECGWGDFNESTHLLTTAKFTDNDRGPNYCPNCGKKVEVVSE